MRRGINPLAILMLVAATVIAFGVALIIRQFIADSISEWSGFIFWGIVILLGGVGAIISGRISYIRELWANDDNGRESNYY